MKVVAKPVDAIAVFIVGRPPRPCKFKYKCRDGKLFTVNVDNVVEVDERMISGRKSFVYQCQSTFGDFERVYELRYFTDTAGWELYKI
jgi:hypothetical protein